MPHVNTSDPKSIRRSLSYWRRQQQKARKLIALRSRQLRRALAAERRAKKPAQAAKFLIDHAGWHEDAGRPNRAAWLDKWAKLIGGWMIGQPWCGLTIWIACRHVGLELTKETVSTVAIRSHAQRGSGGFARWMDRGAEPQIGWVAVYGYPGGPVHTGMYVGRGLMAEGNTSPGNGGSQNNGGGLYLRKLSERQGWVIGWAVPDWSAAT